eukprot:TRINITY_DN12146_c0_g6_i1.p1 TRINITY_DN12146_c0_g6~~TRINITY_DN12146_c0_g6_i1.p1  ORF type:complete len:215 (+),score=58.73 TRINITY_DN12146_c0_g6_i1:25-645(+)
MYSDYKDSTPSTFPPKKWFGNKKHSFIRHRMEELEHFFNVLLEDPELAMSPITQTYFNQKKKKEAKEVKKVVKAVVKQPKAVVKCDKNWRKVVEGVMKSYIDISFGEDPIPPEEVKRKSLIYSKEMDKFLEGMTYSSRVVNMPGSIRIQAENPDLELMRKEKEASEWFEEKMNIIVRTIRNEGDVIYTREGEILDTFEGCRSGVQV